MNRKAMRTPPLTKPAPASGSYPVVGIGASAGGLDAVKRLLGSLPEKSGMAFVVVMHFSPEHASHLDSILATATSMPVTQVRGETAIAPDHVYTIAPGMHLSAANGKLQVERIERPHGVNLEIDRFFHTLASAHAECAYGVILSGMGSDGSAGMLRIKEYGGVSVVQDPLDAQFPSMPESAIAAGVADFILPATEIGRKLHDIWSHSQHIRVPSADGLGPIEVERTAQEDAEEDLQALKDVMVMLQERTGHDFSQYKRATVLRRIERRLQVTGIPTLPAYCDFMRVQRSETTSLLGDLLIGVTAFFRDEEAFAALEKELDRAILAKRPIQQSVRVWVAGCATGEEAYSVAMLMAERSASANVNPEVQIFASDIDERAIAHGRAGMYSENVLADLNAGRRAQFVEQEDGLFQITKVLRDRVLFAAHNLLRDPPFSNLDLVCCRNVLIYLDREIQTKILQLFHFALRPGGLLFLGSSETADALPTLFEPVDGRQRIYRARQSAQARRLAPLLPWNARLRLAEKFPTATRTASDADKLHASLIASHAPASVLTDLAYNILHSTSGVEHFLRFVPGFEPRNLLDVVRKEIAADLRLTVFKALAQSDSASSRHIRVKAEHGTAWISITARPIARDASKYLLVTFEQVNALLGSPRRALKEPDPTVELLEAELKRTREQLVGTLGDSATSNEDLRASNEELQAINEELRSTTEELETSKEELQSLNEELLTVNQELKSNVDSANLVADDLKNLIASSDIATIFVDRKMRIKRYTPGASRLFNLIEADIGRSLLDITHRMQYSMLEADAIEAFETLRTVQREVAGPDDSNYLARVLPYRTHHDVIDGAVLTFVDVSLLRRTEKRLREGEASLQLMAASSPDFAILTLDPAGLVTSWNEGATGIFGYASSQMIGVNFSSLYTVEDRSRNVPQNELRTAIEAGRAVDERWHLHNDGSLFYVSGITTPLFERDKLVGYAKIARDVTQAELEAAKLKELLALEQQVRGELQNAMRMKDEFMAVMSHELRHPLNLIHLNIELLARLPDAQSSPRVAQIAQVIRRAVESQTKVTDDLLDLSRMRNGKLTMTMGQIEWSVLVGNVLDWAQLEIESHGLTLQREIAADLPSIRGDHVRLEQIVRNLLDNAIKFTPSGGTITVSMVADGAQLRLDVRDSGQGIAANNQPFVFDMFRQVDNSSTRQHAGLGIGLALVRHLVHEHKGRVAVASEGVGRGCTFSVWIPHLNASSRSPEVPTRDAGRTSVAMNSVTHTGQAGASALRILLVDDSRDALEAMAMLLEFDGAHVTTAFDATVAIAAVENETFDLLISDIGMPNMDGYALAQTLRSHANTAQLPMVALTGFGRTVDVERAHAAGFDAHLTKPVTMKDLQAVLLRLFPR